MRSIRLKNFRSFRDTGHIELKPLNILVGTNSSGKSSFLRFFPLLKQTASAMSSAPLLLFGHYVDFRDYQNTVCRAAANEPIAVSFSLRGLTVPLRERHFYLLKTPTMKLDLSVSVDIVSGSGRSSIQAVNLSVDECSAEISISQKGIISSLRVNGIDVAAMADMKNFPRCNNTALVPIFERSSESRLDFRKPISRALVSRLQTIYHSNTSLNKLVIRADRLTFGSRTAISEQLSKFARTKPIQPKVMDEIVALLYARWLPTICDSAHSELMSFGRSTKYVAPFRVDPQRYYRIQELSVNQIDVHGENMAMWLKSLSEKELSAFSDWVMSNFGFGVCIKQSGGHIEIEIDVGRQRYNIIDMGYGISQVLPIVAQCWIESLKRGGAHESSSTDEGDRTNTRLIAIEQPELHLHPRIQARLADMFVSMIPGAENYREGMLPTCLIVETHSEHMLSRFGELICENKLSQDNIAVLLFDKDEKTGITEVRQSRFNDDGVLIDWPIGFFSP